ncbi:MAG: DGQHR domain-containing protein [Thermoprotei archaeon]|jgi:DGQHR domain-containing protein
MEVTAFRIKQWGYGKGAGETNLYLTALPLEILAKADIDRWTKTNREGYQRPPLESRLKERGKSSVVRYLLEEAGVFPTSVLVNVRRKLNFKEEKSLTEKISFGRLLLPDDEKLWIIDGQHRLEALKRITNIKPEVNRYPVPTTIMELDDRFLELLMFYIVNTRQKKIPTDIAFRHMQKMVEKVKVEEKFDWVRNVLLGPEEERKGIAALIVDYLASDENSPFYNRIRFVGEEREPEHLIDDLVLETYIAKILKEKAFEMMDPENIASLLIDYWSAIKDLYPSCFKQGISTQYTLLKHTGVASFTYLFPTIYGICVKEGEISRGKMRELIGYLKEEVNEIQDPDFRRPIDEEWWSSAHGPSIARMTGENAFRTITKQFADKIQIVLKKKSKLMKRSEDRG